jgi:agmatine deiminase
MNNAAYHFRLPASWEPQDAILLVWPSPLKDDPDAEDLEELYEALVTLLIDYVDVILVVPGGQLDDVKARLLAMGVPLEYVYFYEIQEESIHVRDFGPFIVESPSGFVLLKPSDQEFINSLLSSNAFPCAQAEKTQVNLSWCEIESNGHQLILANIKGLLQKNAGLTDDSIKNFLLTNTGSTVIDLDESILEAPGLVRLGLLNQMLLLQCDDTASVYFELSKKRNERLYEINQQLENPMQLVALPWAVFVTDDGVEAVADYSQFVVVNETLLVPIFDLPTDEDAMEIISQSFPGFDIFGFPSRWLAQRQTSLLRITQPIPEGVLEPL